MRRVLRLLGGPALGDHLEFLRRHVEAAQRPDAGAVVDAWRAAAQRRADLAAAAPRGVALPACDPLPAALAEPLAALLADPITQRAYPALPVTPAMVDVDALLVMQDEIDLDKSDALLARLRAQPDERALFELAFGRPDPAQARWSLARDTGASWEFVAPGHDLRYLGAEVFDPTTVPALLSHRQGVPVVAVALMVGLSANHVAAVRLGHRLVLHNGYHRVHAMRRAGARRVPCMIESAESVAELQALGFGEIASRADSLFDRDDAPCFADLFDAIQTSEHEAWPLHRAVRLAVEASAVRLMSAG